MNGRTILNLVLGALVVLVLAGIGIGIYNAGVSQGIAQAATLPEGTTVVAPVGYGYGYGHPGFFGFGFLWLLFPIFFILLFVGIARPRSAVAGAGAGRAGPWWLRPERLARGARAPDGRIPPAIARPAGRR